MSAEEAPRRFPAWSVRARILASILLIAAIGLTVAGATAFLLQRDRHLAGIDDRLLARVEAARLVLTGTGTGDPGAEAEVAQGESPAYADTADAVEAVLARVVPGRFDSSLGILDGRARFVPAQAVAFHLEDDPELVQRVVQEVSDGSVRIGTAVSPLGNLRYIAVPVRVGTEGPDGVFLTAVDIDAELAELGEAFATYAIVAAATLLAIGLAGWVVAGRLLRPIRTLRLAASRITAQDLGERIPVGGRDDVSELTKTVNEMLDRLETSLAAQRRLIDDVRHELKTPLTIVRGHLELLDPRDAAEVAATRDLALDELDRMAGLVDDIEALADSTGGTPVLEPVDIADLTADVFAKASAIPGPEWSFAGAPQSIAVLDRARITQAWLQLADNAAKHCDPGTPVAIGSTDGHGEVRLWVQDAGPGIPPEARTRIFERFGRADTGRGATGSGLGLAIVQAIAAAHGGRVDLETSSRGARFTLVIPEPASGRTVEERSAERA